MPGPVYHLKGDHLLLQTLDKFLKKDLCKPTRTVSHDTSLIPFKRMLKMTI
jgi:hypothetical protein